MSSRVKAISSTTTAGQLQTKPRLYLLWNRVPPLPLCIEIMPTSRCYRNIYVLLPPEGGELERSKVTAMYLLKEHGNGNLVLSTSIVEQFWDRCGFTAYRNEEIHHGYHCCAPGDLWGGLFEEMCRTGGSWRLEAPPAPPSQLPEFAPYRHDCQSPTPSSSESRCILSYGIPSPSPKLPESAFNWFATA
ncbi:hypothetical protein PM082_016230 [Marasmius tenuissimus]|nr:hypothetical protein PM082_016230 [Marasmius tenuissimus]